MPSSFSFNNNNFQNSEDNSFGMNMNDGRGGFLNHMGNSHKSNFGDSTSIGWNGPGSSGHHNSSEFGNKFNDASSTRWNGGSHDQWSNGHNHHKNHDTVVNGPNGSMRMTGSTSSSSSSSGSTTHWVGRRLAAAEDSADEEAEAEVAEDVADDRRRMFPGMPSSFSFNNNNFQ